MWCPRGFTIIHKLHLAPIRILGMLSKLFLYSLAGFAQLSPLHAEFVSTSLPTLTLPWGKYEGQPMSDDTNVSNFAG